VSNFVSNSALIAFFLFFIVDRPDTKQEPENPLWIFYHLPSNSSEIGSKLLGFFFPLRVIWKIFALGVLFAARWFLSCSNSSQFHLENESNHFSGVYRCPALHLKFSCSIDSKVANFHCAKRRKQPPSPRFNFKVSLAKPSCLDADGLYPQSLL